MTERDRLFKIIFELMGDSPMAEAIAEDVCHEFFDHCWIPDY